MRYFRSKVKIKLFLFCTLLAYSYLCRKYFPMVVNNPCFGMNPWAQGGEKVNELTNYGKQRRFKRPPIGILSSVL